MCPYMTYLPLSCCQLERGNHNTPFSSCSQFGGLVLFKVQVSSLGITREQQRKNNVAYSPRESQDVSYHKQYRASGVFELKREVRTVFAQIAQALTRVDSNENCRIFVQISICIASQTKRSPSTHGQLNRTGR